MKKVVLLFLIVLITSVSAYTVHAQQDTDGKVINPTVETETIQVPEGTITITEVEHAITSNSNDSFSVQSETYFTDDLNQTCSSGVEFEFSATGPGDVTYQISWSSGSSGNIKYCSGVECHYLITTDWSAFYTDAWAHVENPQTVWGPNDAYRCK